MRRKTSVFWAAAALFFVVASVFAGSAGIEGNVIGLDRRPIANADIRIQPENTKSAAISAKTDAKGHFQASGLSGGSYSVSLLVSGKVMSLVKNVKMSDGKTARLNLAPKQLAAAQPKKRSVYIHPVTGSHMGGYDRPSEDSQNVDQMSQHQMERLQQPVSGRGSGTP